MKKLETQVLIIGAGTTGAAIAREISKYKVDTILVEAQEDIGMGETKASHGFIYGGGLTAASSLIMKSVMLPKGETAYNPNSRKTKMEHAAIHDFPPLAEEIDVDITHDNRIMIAKSEDDIEKLKVAEGLVNAMGAEVTWLDKEGIMDLLPNLTKDAIGGIADPSHQHSVYPWEWAIGLIEHAQQNGVKLMLLTEVLGIKPLDGGFIVETTRGPIRTEFIINAAGPYADKVAEMAGVCDFGLSFTRSQMLILDKRLDYLGDKPISISLAPAPGLARSLRRTISGNIQTICSMYYPVEDPEDTTTLREWYIESISAAQEMIPAISERDIITGFTGVRVFNTRDPEEDIIEASKGNPHFINAVIRLPGVTVTPAMAKYIMELLGDQGLEVVEKTDFIPRRKSIPKISELPDEEVNRLIAQDPRYGNVVCHCEQVTEGEIVEAIRRGARTITGIKYRTRAGMGRCQRNFCGPHVIEILARELNLPVNQITKYGPGSEEVLYSRQ